MLVITFTGFVLGCLISSVVTGVGVYAYRKFVVEPKVIESAQDKIKDKLDGK